IQVSIEPDSKEDQDKLDVGLQSFLKKIQHSKLKPTLKLAKH
ncbi:hypothetical protein Lpp48_00572, partial [Lacticaseibacillus paracasei subsp. paracasei Lpp48]